jgi:Zn-dependent peptidase ImmA (M78 family)
VRIVQASPKFAPVAGAWRIFRDTRAPGDRPHHVANTILRQTGIQWPPIPIENITSQLGLPVFYGQKSAGWTGAADTTQDPPVIWIEAGHQVDCQRLTIGHELGHILLHPSQRTYTCNFYEQVFIGNPLEDEAEEFAISLLVPLWLLEPMVSTPRRSDSASLASIFNVQQRAINAQLRKLA